MKARAKQPPVLLSYNEQRTLKAYQPLYQGSHAKVWKKKKIKTLLQTQNNDYEAIRRELEDKVVFRILLKAFSSRKPWTG